MNRYNGDILVGRAIRKSLAEMLVEENLITSEQLEQALELQRRDGRKLTEVLVNQGMVKAKDLAAVLSVQLNVPLIDLKGHMVQPNALRLIPEHTARKHTLIPLDVVGDTLVVLWLTPRTSVPLRTLRLRQR